MAVKDLQTTSNNLLLIIMMSGVILDEVKSRYRGRGSSRSRDRGFYSRDSDTSNSRGRYGPNRTR